MCSVCTCSGVASATCHLQEVELRFEDDLSGDAPLEDADASKLLRELCGDMFIDAAQLDNFVSCFESNRHVALTSTEAKQRKLLRELRGDIIIIIHAAQLDDLATCPPTYSVALVKHNRCALLWHERRRASASCLHAWSDLQRNLELKCDPCFTPQEPLGQGAFATVQQCRLRRPPVPQLPGAKPSLTRLPSPPLVRTPSFHKRSVTHSRMRRTGI